VVGIPLASAATSSVSIRTLLLGWRISPLGTVTTVAAAIGYVRATARLAARGRHWPAARTSAFLGGLAVVVIALDSGLAGYDDRIFALHVVQHLLLGMLAPALLALGAPVTLAIQASHRPMQRRLVAVVHSRPMAVLTHPLMTWALFGGSMVVLYFTPLYNLSVDHPLVHALVHIHFLVTGILFFWPVVGLDPSRWRLPYGARLLYVFLAVPFHAIVGLALLSSRLPLYAAHSLSDQQSGAAILWGAGDFVTLVAVAIVLSQWMAHDEREAARRDRIEDSYPRERSVAAPDSPLVL
jgi:putative membrane protein